MLSSSNGKNFNKP
jgi:hypothetical protein